MSKYIDLNILEKEQLLNLIIANDIRGIRLVPITSINLNYLFPTKDLYIDFDTYISPLHLTCYIGKLEIFTYLLTNDNINVNIQTKKEGYTPLMLACYKGNYEIVRMLLERNADINITNKNGQLPIVFCFNRIEQNSYLYENKRIFILLVNLLLYYKADINSLFNIDSGYTMIMKLCETECIDDEKFKNIVDILKFLIERGSDISIKGKDNKNVYDVLRENKKIFPKYKEDIYFVLNNTKQNIIYTEESNDNGQFDISNAINNTLPNNIFKTKHSRNLSTLFGAKNYINKKNELLLQTNDNDSSNCCLIF